MKVLPRCLMIYRTPKLNQAFPQNLQDLRTHLIQWIADEGEEKKNLKAKTVNKDKDFRIGVEEEKLV